MRFLWTVCSSPSRHLPLPVSPAHNGAGAADRGAENARHPHRQRALQPVGALLGQDFRHQLRPRRGDRHPHGIPIRHQLGALLALRRRRDRPNAGHGRRIRLLFGIRVSRFVPLRREAAEQVGTLDCRPAGSARLVDLGILHHRHRRLDAAPGGLFHRAERQRTAPELLGPGAEPVGVVAVRAQHERRHDHGLVCHGRAGRLVSAHTQA